MLVDESQQGDVSDVAAMPSDPVASEPAVTVEVSEVAAPAQESQGEDATPKSRLDSLNEAYSKLTGDGVGEKKATGERVRDASGKFAKADKAPEKAPVVTSINANAPKSPEVAQTGASAPATVPQPAKAPQSWTPAEREAWAQVPPAAQAAILRREKEAKLAIDRNAEGMKRLTEFDKAILPFEAHIRGEGSTPVQAVSNLMGTAMALRSQDPYQRARVTAEIISRFRVDPGMVAQILGGQAQGQQRQATDPAFIAQQVTQQVMSQFQQQRQQTLEAKAAQEAEKFFSEREFAAELAPIMSTYFDVQGARGLQPSWDEAYNYAASVHPEVRQILEQRKAAQSAANAQASTQRSKNAASSIRNSPTKPAAPNSGPRTRMEALSAVYDDLSNR